MVESIPLMGEAAVLGGSIAPPTEPRERPSSAISAYCCRLAAIGNPRNPKTLAISWNRTLKEGRKPMEVRRLRSHNLLQDSFSPRARLLARADAVAGVPCMPAASSGGGVSDDVASALARLQADVEAGFPGCEGLAGATRCVFGEGSPAADVVFVGEAPGAEEDRVGRPFVGPAGRKLDEIIAAMGFRREDVYICNILKARPPGNRPPLPDEIAMSLPWLHRQLSIIGPQVIVALGGPAAKTLLNTETGITRLRGRMAGLDGPRDRPRRTGDANLPSGLSAANVHARGPGAGLGGHEGGAGGVEGVRCRQKKSPPLTANVQAPCGGALVVEYCSPPGTGCSGALEKSVKISIRPPE